MGCYTLAIGGGKGGVGKSIVAANLAIAMARKGFRVIIVDADLGGSNLHTLLGVKYPTRSLGDFLHKTHPSLSDVLCPTAEPNLNAVFGGNKQVGDANINYGTKTKFIRHINQLPAQVVIIDLGAGMAFNELDLFNCAMGKVVVFAPEVTSVQNGYAFIKAAVHRQIHRMLPVHVRNELANDPRVAGHPKKLVEQIGRFDIQLQRQADLVLEAERINIVGNMVQTSKDRKSISNLQTMLNAQMHLNTRLAGFIQYDTILPQTVNHAEPYYVAGNERNLNRRHFDNLAENLLRDVADDMPLQHAPQTDRVPNRPERRAFTRQPLTGTMVALRADDNSLYRGRVLNLSGGGLMARFPLSLKRCSHYQMMIGPLSIGQRIISRVEPVHHTKTNKYLDIGFRFASLGDEMQQSLTEFLSQTEQNTLPAILP